MYHETRIIRGVLCWRGTPDGAWVPSSEELLPNEQAWEDLWKETNGLDIDGRMWLTPRMLRAAEKLEKSWAEE